jgi:aldehyde:ferredoxin oxidoreductase
MVTLGEKVAAKILRLDMTELKATMEDVPEGWKNLGGRGLTSSIVAAEVPADCHPLGPNNKLVMAPGIVTGTRAPTSGRISVGGKSPLTGGIKEANAGTSFAQKVAKLGIKAIVVEGQAEPYQLVHIRSDEIEFHDAVNWTNTGLYRTFEEIRNRYGQEVGISACGIAAEMGGAASGVAFNDPEGMSSRYAGRGGLGAVMASRGLKFIVADDSGGPGVPIANEEVFKNGTRKLAQALSTHDITKKGGTLNTYGTNALINVINEAGALPHRNFSAGYDDLAPMVSGEKKAEVIKKRGGVRPHGCSPGCIIQCSEVWVKEGGVDPVGVLEYESVWALGPNCGIYDLDDVGELNRACNDLGVDTIEMGDTIGVAMEGGLIPFGDGKGAIKLMKEIEKKTATGRILANGTAFAGQAFGVSRVPVVKGQGLPAYDPRPIKGIGVTYATTPMGADHTAGYAIAPEILGVGGKVDPLDKKKGELSRALQNSTAFIDTSGYCLFTAFAIMDIAEGFEGMVESCNGVLGTNWSGDDAVALGSKILEIERAFNKRAGFTNEDDRLPEFFRIEPLPPSNEVYDVPADELDSVFGK